MMSGCAVFQPVMAENESDKDVTKSSWNGEAEIGFIMTRGNTETDTLNAKLQLENVHEKWLHKIGVKTLQSSDRTETTAESYEGLFRSEYKLSDDDFLFGSFRYEDDRFAGYDQRTTEVVGYGYRVLNTDKVKLSLEAGVGARQTEATDDTSDDEGILRAGIDYSWNISKTSSLSEDLFVEHGKDNTFTESVTEFKVRINSKLAMKLSLTVKNDSAVIAGTKNTDSKTAVTLVYDF